MLCRMHSIQHTAWSKTETCRSDIYVYFNVHFNVFFKLIKVHLLVSEIYIYQNARCKDKNSTADSYMNVESYGVI